MGQSCLATSRLVHATFQVGLSFSGTNQTILLLIQKRKVQAEKLVSITPHKSQSDLRENWYDSASLVLVSLVQVAVGTSLRRRKLAGFIKVPMRRHKDVSNRSFLLTYQLRLLDDVSTWCGMLKLVTKICQFLLITKKYILALSQVVQSLLGTSQYVVTTSQRRPSDLGTSCSIYVTC